MGIARPLLWLTAAVLAAALPAYAQDAGGETEAQAEGLKALAGKPEAKPEPTFTLPTTDPAQITLSGDGQTVFVVGMIGPGSFLQFTRMLRTNPRVNTVHLASYGGLVMEGYLMGNAVRARGLTTRVEHVCASACTQIFASGTQRVLGAHARLGFHQTYQQDGRGQTVGAQDYTEQGQVDTTLQRGTTFSLANNGDDNMVRAMRRAGVSDAFITHVLRTPPDGLWYPEVDELLREGMATRLSDPAPAAQLPFGSRSIELVSEVLAANPFWAAIRQYRTPLFDEAARSVWRDTNSGVPVADAEISAREPVVTLLYPAIVGAPDALLDKFVRYFALDAAIQRENDFPGCNHSLPKDPDGVAARYADIQPLIDSSYAELLTTPVAVTVPSPDQARRTMRRNARRLAETGLVFRERPDNDAGYCREGVRAYEAIGHLEPRQRLETFRALQVLSRED